MAGGRLCAPANLSAGPRAGQEAQPVHRSHGSGAPITPSGQARRQRSAPPPRRHPDHPGGSLIATRGWVPEVRYRRLRTVGGRRILRRAGAQIIHSGLVPHCRQILNLPCRARAAAIWAMDA